MIRRIRLLSASILLSANAIAANLVVLDPYARETPPGAANGAVFMTLDNQGDQARTLLSVSSDVARKVELHNHVMVDELMQMRRVDAIRIAPHRQTRLQPGGLHVMLLGLKRPLLEGERIALTLTFANGEQQQLTVPVTKVMAGMNHPE